MRYAILMMGRFTKIIILKIETLGGWHDAGDFGKYTVPTAVTLADLLMAYEFFPTVFEESINIPESGNGVPDILNESRFALDWLLKMQDLKTGGVHHKVSTKSFPGFIMPEKDSDVRYINQIPEGSWSTNEVTTYWNSPAIFVAAYFDQQ